MSQLTVKSSTILVSVGDKTKVYRSVRDVPPVLRRKLIESTQGENSDTFVIANRRGKEEIDRVVRTMPPELSEQYRRTLALNSPSRVSPIHRFSPWLEIALAGGAAAAVWLAVHYR